jgi:phosphatidate phosphatase APP1
MKPRLNVVSPFRSALFLRLTGVATRVVTYVLALFLLSIGGVGTSNPAFAEKDSPATGEQIVFFPSPAALSKDGKSWLLTIQGRIFKPVAAGKRRGHLIDAIARVAGLTKGEKVSGFLRQRVGYFLSDSKGRERVSIRIGDQTFPLQASDAAGYFITQIPLASDQAIKLAKDGVISFESLTTPANRETFKGQTVLVPEEGIFVVTDMDDTIKDSHVLNRKELLKNTFVRDFTPVEGMSGLYRSWKTRFGDRMQFEVVSAGPWQLNEPLSEFTESAGFPTFFWQMRSVDVNAAKLWELVAKPYCFKVRAIETLMRLFPKRHFVLVGDSGEQDPEVYSTILLEFPNQVDAVFVRQVSELRPPSGVPVCAGVDPAFIRQVPKNLDNHRFQILFPKTAAAKVYLFHDPKELPALETLVH